MRTGYFELQLKKNIICNEHIEVIFTFDHLFFVGYMNDFV